MFLQIIQGPVSDAALFEREASRWRDDLKPGAPGYLGCTWGISEDGVGFLAARFDSAASAEANSTRPEQGEWWAAMEKAFAAVEFRDCAEVDAMMGGGSDEAGFVQVISGRVNDRAAARTMLREAEGQLAVTRPDILGGVFAWHGGDGDFTQLMYFRSVDDARAGEGSSDDDEVDAGYRDMMAVEPTFVDLTSPQFD
jgi:hypothetical protein